jgi:hypothetical protein
MPNGVNPIGRIEAQTKLENLKLKADLEDLDRTLDELFQVKVPELSDITTPEELKELIGAVEQGTADNHKLARFIDIANTILAKV